jgi:hypothetical protein
MQCNKVSLQAMQLTEWAQYWISTAAVKQQATKELRMVERQLLQIVTTIKTDFYHNKCRYIKSHYELVHSNFTQNLHSHKPTRQQKHSQQ